MSGFSALLKLSQLQTAQSELAIQTQMASHQMQLEKKRQEQETKERQEREREAKLRLKRLEEQHKEEDRKRKRAEEDIAREKMLAKREEQLRDALKYGPRKAAASASGSSSKSRGIDKGGEFQGGSVLTREELRKRQNEFSDISSPGLTREEKRELRLAAELRRATVSSSRRSGAGSSRTTSLPDGRTVRRLPGGAVDYTTVSRLANPDAPAAVPSADLAGKSARERLAALPSTLMKLNTVKRDLRTIDEILADRAKAKQATTLAGDEAKEFSDWFGKGKKKVAPQSSLPQQPASTTSSRGVSATPSGSPAPTVNSVVCASAKTKLSSPGVSSKTCSPFFKSINPKPNMVYRPTSGPVPSSSKKRPCSSPDGDSTPPPAKRRLSASSRPAPVSSRSIASSTSESSSRPSTLGHGVVDLSAEIWNLFGKDKKSYVARDVLSDDEDMEADAESVLKEEARSARLAHKEDEYALWQEKRHDEEKRRRRKERERKERA